MYNRLCGNSRDLSMIFSYISFLFVSRSGDVSWLPNAKKVRCQRPMLPVMRVCGGAGEDCCLSTGHESVSRSYRKQQPLKGKSGILRTSWKKSCIGIGICASIPNDASAGQAAGAGSCGGLPRSRRGGRVCMINVT
jgi:hypothetical protein